MNTSSPYLRVGPVAIHIHSRETNHGLVSPPSEYSPAEPTLDVQGSVFLSPDNGTLIEELNGVLPSNTVSASPSALPLPVPPSPSPPSAVSTPSPPISSAANVDHSVLSPAPIPSSATSIQEPDAQRSSSPGPQVAPTLTPSPTLPQGTAGSLSSTPTPQSLPSSDPQPTVLAGSTIAAFPDPSLVESMGTTLTNSLETASPTMASNNFTTGKNTVPIIVGSILAAMLGAVLIIAVLTWFLRVRSRRRSDDELSWDPEPSSGHIYDNDNFFDPPPFQVGQDRAVSPIQSQPPGPTTMLQPNLVEPLAMRTPYPRLATPELAHTAGPLTVTNLLPGDVPLSANTSIFMGSRPGSAQVTPRIGNSTPRFMHLQDGGLPVPWSRGAPESTKGPVTRPRAWPSRLSAVSLKKVFSSSPQSTKIDPIQPRTSAVNIRSYFNNTGNNNTRFPEPARTADQTWSGTIRAGIANALGAVMGTSARPPEALDRNLTPIPPRLNRRLSSKTGTFTLNSVSRTSTLSAGVGFPTQGKGKSEGIVPIDLLGFPRETPPFNETIKEEQSEEEGDTGSLPFPGFSTSNNVLPRKIDSEAPVPEIPRLPDDVMGRPSSVPRLPTIRPLSRAWTLRSEGFITLPESDDGYRSAFNQMINERKQEYDRRLAELETVAAEEASRPVMSRASTTSLMTESTALSRESSVMDEEERKAKKVLRMRRKRAMALSAVGAGNGNISGRRTSLRKRA